MNRLIWMLLVWTMSASLLAAAPAPQALVDRAELLLSQIASGDYTGATQDFTPRMRSLLSAEKLAEVWKQLTGQLGTLQRREPPRVEEAPGGARTVIIPCAFEKARLDARITYDVKGQVAGLLFSPAAQAPAATSALPDYARPEAFKEEAVQIGSERGALPGLLSLPMQAKAPFAAVVLLHGSGPNDRDGAIGPNRPFRDLAAGLATRGIAVLRYDKRTRVYPEQSRGFTVREEVLDDARAALALLSRRPEIDKKRLYVLGHSLGGMLLPRLAQAEPGLAGLVFLAAPARPLEDLLIDQVTYLAGPEPDAQTRERLATLRAQVARVKSPDLTAQTPAAQLPLNVPASYWLDLRGYHPPTVAARLPQPLLVLQGGRDYQVTAVDFEQWRKALAGHASAQLKLYPGLNHLFMAGEGQGTPAEYERPGYVDASVVEQIATWIGSGGSA